MTRLASGDRGAVLPIVAILLVVLLLVAAFVIDLGGVRVERASNQVVADAAAAAGALTAAAAESNVGEQVCNDVKAYVAINSSGISGVGDLAGIECSGYPPSCDSSTAEHTSSTSVNGVTVEIAFPVQDDSDFMDSRQIGAPDQPASADDGDKCQRVGVRIQTDWSGTFSRLIGIEEIPANVHAVARTQGTGGEDAPLNLLVLERYDCKALRASGSNNAGIIVGPLVADGGSGTAILSPGLAASDSDGSDCPENDGVVYLDGSNVVMRADGPAGCSSQVGTETLVVPAGTPIGSGTTVSSATLTVGQGCGEIASLANSAPDCSSDGCFANDSNPPVPYPGVIPGRLTRAPIDHQYNCWSNYLLPPSGTSWAVDALLPSVEQDIPGCSGDDDHIYDLIELVGPVADGVPLGFVNYTDLGGDCSHGGAPGSTYVYSGANIRVDCDPFEVKRNIIFTGGNVVFDGDVLISSSGGLGVNIKVGLVDGEWVPVDSSGQEVLPFDEDVEGTGPAYWVEDLDEAWVFFRGGSGGAEFSKTGQASLVMLNTMAYFSKRMTDPGDADKEFSLAGGSNGVLRWVAPITGVFEDLALWSDGQDTHSWSGQAELDLEGVFFVPWTRVEYVGQGEQEQVAAQFVSKSLHASGQGALYLQPRADRAVSFPIDPITMIIR